MVRLSMLGNFQEYQVCFTSFDYDDYRSKTLFSERNLYNYVGLYCFVESSFLARSLATSDGYPSSFTLIMADPIICNLGREGRVLSDTASTGSVDHALF